MRYLSLPGSPLPAICGRGWLLTAEASDCLEEALFPSIPIAVADYFWNMVSRLQEILRELPASDRGMSNNSGPRLRILDLMTILLHEISSLTEYLVDVLGKILPSVGRKNKAAQQAKNKLHHIVDRLFKIPINLVKHERFKLQWLDQYEQSTVTAGFTVNGKIDKNLIGSASYRFESVAEGFSFAFILRKILPSIFEICEVAEDALDQATLFRKDALPSSPVVRPDRYSMLVEVVGRLASLPYCGFPNERSERVMKLSLDNFRLGVEGTVIFTALSPPYGCEFQIESVIPGETYKLPYWIPIVN